MLFPLFIANIRQISSSNMDLSKMIPRTIRHYIYDSAKKYPALAIMGPRQSGKTTSVKDIFPDKPYVSLEDPDIRRFAIEDPRAFLARYPNGAIFDEIQRTPEILSYLQTILDADPSPGRYILTGSHQLMLLEAITQSLAGRINLITLLPLSIEELKYFAKPDGTLNIDDYLYEGFYPRIYANHLNPTEYYRNYLQTYVERDVRRIINLKDLGTFERFLKLCAGRVGQVLNYDSLANDVGVSAKTIKEWLSILEASFIIKILQPYFENLGKRLNKSPKLYFIDVGLASYLLDLHEPSQINRDPLRGGLIENLCVMEMYKFYLNRGVSPSLYYLREQNGNEIDIILKQGHKLIPFEVKAASTYTSSFLKALKWFKKLLPDRVDEAYLLYNGIDLKMSDNINLCHWSEIDRILQSINLGQNTKLNEC